jgi:hypothetical protein
VLKDMLDILRRLLSHGFVGVWSVRAGCAGIWRVGGGIESKASERDNVRGDDDFDGGKGCKTHPWFIATVSLCSDCCVDSSSSSASGLLRATSAERERGCILISEPSGLFGVSAKVMKEFLEMMARAMLMSEMSVDKRGTLSPNLVKREV